MKKIYVAGKYSADNVIDVLANIGKGEAACCELFHDGFAVFCPWHDKSYVTGACYAALFDKDIFYNASLAKDMFYAASLAWLEVSDAVYVISGVGDGGGVDREIAHAEELGIPVFYDYRALNDWALENDI